MLPVTGGSPMRLVSRSPAVDVPVPGDRPAGPGHRCAAVWPARPGGRSVAFTRAPRGGTIPAEVATDGARAA